MGVVTAVIGGRFRVLLVKKIMSTKLRNVTNYEIQRSTKSLFVSSLIRSSCSRMGTNAKRTSPSSQLTEILFAWCGPRSSPSAPRSSARSAIAADRGALSDRIPRHLSLRPDLVVTSGSQAICGAVKPHRSVVRLSHCGLENLMVTMRAVGRGPGITAGGESRAARQAGSIRKESRCRKPRHARAGVRP